MTGRPAWHTAADGGGLEANLPPGVRLRVVPLERAVASDEPAFLAWVDAFRRTYTQPEAHADVRSAKRAAVALALRVALERQERVRQVVTAAARHGEAADPALEADLDVLNRLLLVLLEEAERLEAEG